MSAERTWKHRTLSAAGLVVLVLGMLLALAGVVVLFTAGFSAGLSVLVPGLAVAAAGTALRGYGRGESGAQGPRAQGPGAQGPGGA